MEKTCFSCGNTSIYEDKKKGKTYFSTCDSVQQCYEDLDEFDIQDLKEGCPNWKRGE